LDQPPTRKQLKAKASALLGVIEEQCYYAQWCLRQPTRKHGINRALAVLLRVTRICGEYDGAVTPSVALALVKLRLNVAAVYSRLGSHEQALHEAQQALREADGVAQALDAVGDPAQEDTAVLACLAQQAIAAELAHLEAPELSITNMLQNASMTAQSFLPATHPLGKLASSFAQKRVGDAALTPGDAGLQDMLRKGLQGSNAGLPPLAQALCRIAGLKALRCRCWAGIGRKQ